MKNSSTIKSKGPGQPHTLNIDFGSYYQRTMIPKMWVLGFVLTLLNLMSVKSGKQLFQLFNVLVLNRINLYQRTITPLNPLPSIKQYPIPAYRAYDNILQAT